MDNNLFDDLVASIKEAGAIKRNEIKASRVTELELPDIKEVREKTGCLLIVVQKEGRGKILQGGFVYLFNSGILCGFFVGAFGESPK